MDKHLPLYTTAPTPTEPAFDTEAGSLALPGNPQGLYVHVPFCAKRCDYCDFTTFAGREHQMQDYASALATELTRIGNHWNGHQLHTLFIGGGTPTLLANAQLVEILSAIRSQFTWASDAEWTIEANPETVDASTAQCLVDQGINRVSMGAQSFDSTVLDRLGRWHRPGQVARALTHLRHAGIKQISVDLIFGTPGESAESWANSLQTALALGTDHLSAYALTVEPATPYGRAAKTNPGLLPDEDLQGERLIATAEVLADWDHYEVSNWARTPANRCRHNLGYWHGDDWLATGVGATGALGNRRWWNTRSINRYLSAIANNQSPEGGHEYLDADALRTEALMMGLRTIDGVQRSRIEPLNQDRVNDLIQAGLVVTKEDRLAINPKHFSQVDGVVRTLV